MKAKNLDLSRLNLLVVEDNKYMQIVLREILYTFNMRNIANADDGADALKLLQTYPADLIITDWRMSPLDGLDLVSMIRNGSDSQNPYVPIIMLTGHTEYHRVLEASNAGINEFLAKPVSPRQLYARIANIVERPRAFVKTKSYFGPDRRRSMNTRRPYEGKERRKSNAVTSTESAAKSLATG